MSDVALFVLFCLSALVCVRRAERETDAPLQGAYFRAVLLATPAYLVTGLLSEQILTFTSVAHLQAAIQDYLSAHNANPKPFVWTKTADVILEKERRALDAFETVKGGYQALESEH